MKAKVFFSIDSSVSITAYSKNNNVITYINDSKSSRFELQFYNSNLTHYNY